ncbi:MAG: tetratricopeptide repeat protein [Pseudomonadota bacterium]
MKFPLPIRTRFLLGLVLSSALALVGCGDSTTPEEHLANAVAFEKAGDLAAAIVEVKNVVQLQPENREARAKLGFLQLEVGEYGAALKELQRAKKFGGGDDNVERGVVRALIMTGQHEQAATELALHGNFSNYDWRLLQAQLDLQVGRFEDARDTLQSLLQERPDDNIVRSNLVGSLLQLNDFETAHQLLDEALEEDGDSAGLWVIKGQLAVLDEKYEEADKAYSKALEKEPQAYAAVLGRIVANAGLEQYDEAEALFELLPEGADGDLRVAFLRGVIAEGQERPSDAISQFRTVIQSYPDHREALQKLARLFFESGDTTQAIEYLQRLTALDPNNEVYRKQLGAAQLAAGRLDNAFDELMDMDISIENQTDANFLALLGSAYSKQGQYTEGVESLQRAYELAPDSTPIAIQLALSYLRGGDSTKASDILEETLKREPNNQTANVLLILAYSGNEPENAKSAMDSLIERQPDSALPFNRYYTLSPMKVVYSILRRFYLYAKCECNAYKRFERCMQCSATLNALESRKKVIESRKNIV